MLTVYTILRVIKNVILAVVDFVVAYWKIVLPVIAVLIIGLFLRSCWTKHTAKLNEQQIIAAQQAIAKQDTEAMKKVLVESDVAEKQIDEATADAHAQTVNATEESKQKWANADNKTMADELNRRAQQ